jgi:hypothetical protein
MRLFALGTHGSPKPGPDRRARPNRHRSPSGVLKAWLAGAAVLLSALQPVQQGLAAEPAWDGAGPAPGVYFDDYEPSLYTGFAPRTQDPTRIHLELSRGNQLRLTLVLGPDELDAYLDNLLAKRDLVRELLAKGVIRLTTNREFDRFAKGMQDARVEETVAARNALGPETFRHKTIDIMAKLNPGRVFRIAIPVERLVRDWHDTLARLGKEGLDSADARIGAANAILPGRANLYELDDRLKTELKKAAALAVKSPSDGKFTAQALSFLALATGGHYPIIDNKVAAVEFTAVYPAATAMAWTPYNELKLPEFGVTGAWPLIPRTQGRGPLMEVDYISPGPGYGFIPLLAYQHAGGVYYNSLEGPGLRMGLDTTPFLPEAWRKATGEVNPKKGFRNLWVGSRGPTSRGSTRLPAGHMSELRDILPSRSEALERVLIFRNLPQCFDLFDVDGDGKAKAVGLQYYLAYWINRNTPREPYAPNDRKGFYAWLYKGNAEYKKGDRAFLKEVPVCRFVGLRKAVDAGVLNDVPLYEAPSARESIQFYLTIPVRFDSDQGIGLDRELRRIGAGYDLDRYKLLLDSPCCSSADRSEIPR